MKLFILACAISLTALYFMQEDSTKLSTIFPELNSDFNRNSSLIECKAINPKIQYSNKFSGEYTPPIENSDGYIILDISKRKYTYYIQKDDSTAKDYFDLQSISGGFQSRRDIEGYHVTGISACLINGRKIDLVELHFGGVLFVKNKGIPTDKSGGVNE